MEQDEVFVRHSRQILGTDHILDSFLGAGKNGISSRCWPISKNIGTYHILRSFSAQERMESHRSSILSLVSLVLLVSYRSSVT